MKDALRIVTQHHWNVSQMYADLKWYYHTAVCFSVQDKSLMDAGMDAQFGFVIFWLDVKLCAQALDWYWGDMWCND